MGAGDTLRAAMNAALARASKDAGGDLVWDEKEQAALDAACAAADRAERLTGIAQASTDAGEVVKLSAELRMLEKHRSDMLARLSLDTGPAKSARHQRAANARWDRRDAHRAAARQGGA